MSVEAIIEKLPAFDSAWTPEVQAKWLDALQSAMGLIRADVMARVLPQATDAPRFPRAEVTNEVLELVARQAEKNRPPAKIASGGRTKKPSYDRLCELLKEGSRIAQVYRQLEKEFPNPEDRYPISSISTFLQKLSAKGLIPDRVRRVRPKGFYSKMKLVGYALYQQRKSVLEVFLALDDQFGDDAPTRPDIVRKWFEDWDWGRGCGEAPSKKLSPLLKRWACDTRVLARAHELIDQGIKPRPIHEILVKEFGELAPRVATTIYAWRDKRKKLNSEKVVVAIDCAPGDVPTMVIAKQGGKKGSITVLDVIQPEAEESAKPRVNYDSFEDSKPAQEESEPKFRDDQPHYFSEIMKLRCLVLMKEKKHWNEVLEVIKQEFPDEVHYPEPTLVHKWYLRWLNRGLLKKEEGPVTTPGRPKGKPRLVASVITDTDVAAMRQVQQKLSREVLPFRHSSRDWSQIQTGGELNRFSRCNRDGLPVTALAVCLDWQFLWRVKDLSIPAKVSCCHGCPNWIQTAEEIKTLISRFGSFQKTMAAVTEDPQEDGEEKKVGRPGAGGDRTSLKRKMEAK